MPVPSPSFDHGDERIESIEHHRRVTGYPSARKVLVDQGSHGRDGRISLSSFKADHVVDVRRKAVGLSGRMTIREKRKKSVRRMPGMFLKDPRPMSRVPALTFCRTVVGSASNTSMRTSGRSARNSLMACGRMFAATSSPAPTDRLSLAFPDVLPER